jgi:membrane protease YdiL (CAAX protease family)
MQGYGRFLKTQNPYPVFFSFRVNTLFGFLYFFLPSPVLQYIRGIFVNTFLESESASAEYLRLNQGKSNGKILFICIYVAFGLTVIHYFMDVSFTSAFLKNIGATKTARSFESLMYSPQKTRLWTLAWWAILIISIYFVIPASIILLVFREKLSDYGLRLGQAFKDIRIYFFMLCVMIPLVLFFSGTKSFQSRYPFYDLQPGESMFPDFIIWECLYFLQFFSLEFFFRGFMLHGLKQRFGFYSVFVMIIPYCMIHFGKPMPETIAAIIAGIVLGVLSLKSRSVYLGVLIHYSVAITMDLCALWQKGTWTH